VAVGGYLSGQGIECEALFSLKRPFSNMCVLMRTVSCSLPWLYGDPVGTVPRHGEKICLLDVAGT